MWFGHSQKVPSKEQFQNVIDKPYLIILIKTEEKIM